MAHPQAPVLVHAEQTGIQTVYVYDDDGSRYMTFGPLGADQPLVQSEVFLNADGPMYADYLRALVALVATHPHADRVLVIGVGGGTLPTSMRRIVPHARIDAVDHDDAVIRIAQELFGLSNDHVALHAMDGRRFVQRALTEGAVYDTIVIDAFDKDYIPEHLMTVEFLHELEGILAPGGLIAINSFGTGALWDRSGATFSAAFGDEFRVLVAESNRIVVARPRGLPPADEAAAHAAHSRARLLQIVGVDHDWVAQQVKPAEPWNRDARPVLDGETGSDELRRLRETARFGACTSAG